MGVYFAQKRVFLVLFCSRRHAYTVRSDYSAQGNVFHCKLRHQGCSSAQRLVFHLKLRSQGCSFTSDE